MNLNEIIRSKFLPPINYITIQNITIEYLVDKLPCGKFGATLIYNGYKAYANKAIGRFTLDKSTSDDNFSSLSEAKKYCWDHFDRYYRGN